MSPRAATAASSNTNLRTGTAHMAWVTGLVRSRFTSDAVRTSPDAKPTPLIHLQYGFFAQIAGLVRKNQSGKNHGHQKPAMVIASERRCPTNTSRSQTASSTAVLSASTVSSPRALILAESSAVFGPRLHPHTRIHLPPDPDSIPTLMQWDTMRYGLRSHQVAHCGSVPPAQPLPVPPHCLGLIHKARPLQRHRRGLERLKACRAWLQDRLRQRQVRTRGPFQSTR